MVFLVLPDVSQLGFHGLYKYIPFQHQLGHFFFFFFKGTGEEHDIKGGSRPENECMHPYPYIGPNPCVNAFRLVDLCIPAFSAQRSLHKYNLHVKKKAMWKNILRKASVNVHIHAVF